VNEVYLEPAAAQAFHDIHLYKGLERTARHPSVPLSADMTNRFNRAEAAMDILRRELLRFRKRTLRDWLRDRRLVRKPIVPKKPTPTA
jgi:hypothetical protein